MIKKIIFGLILLTAILFFAGYIAGGKLIEKGVEKYGPEALKVPVELGSVNLSLFTASGNINDLVLGQPTGFGEGPMISVGGITFNADLTTLLKDHVIIENLVIDSPQITSHFEGLNNNLLAFTNNLPEFDTSVDDSNSTPITVTVKRLAVKSPKLSLSTDGLVELDHTFDLPDVTLTDLGNDTKGLSPDQIARRIMDKLMPEITRVIASKNVKKEINDLKENAEKKAQEKIDGVKDEFNKAKKGLLGKLGKKDDPSE